MQRALDPALPSLQAGEKPGDGGRAGGWLSLRGVGGEPLLPSSSENSCWRTPLAGFPFSWKGTYTLLKARLAPCELYDQGSFRGSGSRPLEWTH